MRRLRIVGMLALTAGLLIGVTGCGTAPSRGGGNTAAESGDRLAQIKTELGIEYMRDGRDDVALERLQEALQIVADYAPAHMALGMLYSKLRQFEDAERHFRRSLSIDPDDSGTLNNFGLFLCQHNRADEALAMFDRAAANPVYRTPEIAYSNAGTCILRNGDRDGAEQRFRQALRINPKLPPALLQMASISFDLNRYLPARGYLQRYAEVAEQTAASLWLGINIERALGDNDTLGRYEQRLRQDFPDSEEARLLLESRARPR